MGKATKCQINLFINPYEESNPNRKREMDACLAANINNPSITGVYLLQDKPQPDSGKVHVYKTRERPTYADFFNAINQTINQTGVHPNEVVSVIANTDIFFDHTSLQLAAAGLRPNQCYALSRWDIDKNGEARLWNHSDSQDVWMFKGMVKEVPSCHFQLGIPGCDNAIAERLERAGYEVLNPALTIRSYHLHLTNERAYQCPKPYKYIEPTTLR